MEMMHSYEARYRQFAIRPLLKKDIEFLRIWRNDKILSKYLRPVEEITPKMQREWFNNYLLDKSILFFAIINCIDCKVVGSLAVYGINGDKAEIGKIIIGDSSSRGKGLGYVSLVMAMETGYKELGINYFTLDCHEDNKAAMKSYLKIGFEEIGRHRFIKGGHEIKMAVSKKKFYKKNKILDEIHINSSYDNLYV